MGFIYALNEEDRDELMARGYELLFTSNINGVKAYAFQEDNPSRLAMFGEEDKRKLLFTNMAYF